jgi:hypothetical protein
MIVPKDVTPCSPVNALTFQGHLHSPLATAIMEADGSYKTLQLTTEQHGIISSLFLNVTQRRLLVSYRRFGTIYCPIVMGQ